MQSSKVLKYNQFHPQVFDEAARDKQLVRLFSDYNSSGITGIIDRNCSTSARAQYERLLDAGKLTVRVRASRGISSNGDSPPS